MIYVRLAGGLGNQLFQLAAASLLSQANAISNHVIPLIGGLHRYDEPREPDSIELLQADSWLLPPTTSVSFFWRELSLGIRSGRWMPVVGISDRNFWKVIGKKTCTSKLMDGYFQRGWTRENFERAIARMPARSVSESAAARIASDEVILHIRGGDFLSIEKFQVVDSSYYVRAIREAMHRDQNRFAILSDDPVYAASIYDRISREIPNIEIRMIPKGANALEDFDTLRASTARIIGNSTFAWWATVFGLPEAPTWSPLMFMRDKPRDFFLQNEFPTA